MGKFVILLALLWMGASFAVPNSNANGRRHANDGQCSRISLLEDNLDVHRMGILEELCEIGHKHTKSQGQFAVLNIHADTSTNDVQWTGGKCPNVAHMDEWRVDDIVPLKPGHKGTGSGAYYWYTNGVPMWPILNQCTKRPGMRSRLLRRSKGRWPNYALAMPLYHIKRVCETTRHISIAVTKVFKTNLSPANFSKPLEFQKFVVGFMRNFLDDNGYECMESQLEKIENYDKWLKPIVTESLPAMLKSTKKCPGELFIFFHDQPDSSFIGELERDVKISLKRGKCPSVSVVIGFSSQ